MGHDYSLPFGPWGSEEEKVFEQEHRALLRRFVLLCTSQHLANYLRRWSVASPPGGDGGAALDARACYCADYNYFQDRPSPKIHLCVGFRQQEHSPPYPSSWGPRSNLPNLNLKIRT